MENLPPYYTMPRSYKFSEEAVLSLFTIRVIQVFMVSLRLLAIPAARRTVGKFFQRVAKIWRILSNVSKLGAHLLNTKMLDQI